MKNDLICRGDLLKRIERQEKKNVETVPLELLRVMVEGVEKVDVAKINKANGWVKLPKGSTQSCKFCGA